VCHQTVGLAARHLEANGMPSLVIGSARDILDEIGVPRFAFTELPLGNPIGPAGDPDQQRRILSNALQFAEAAVLPRTSVVLKVDWSGAPNWRETYMALDNPESLRLAGEERRAEQAKRKAWSESTESTDFGPSHSQSDS
jgi:D-proline reductase (dithiol) PrdB